MFLKSYILSSRRVTGSPDDYLGEDCMSIYIHDGYWNDENCESQRGYICKRRGESGRKGRKQLSHRAGVCLVTEVRCLFFFLRSDAGASTSS